MRVFDVDKILFCDYIETDELLGRRHGMATKKILLVDDTKLFLELEKNFLKLSPVRILTASSGEEALEIARSEHPDLIFMDIHMPGMGGVACCREMKSDSTLRTIPIVMVSSCGKEEDVEQCRKAGCDGYVTKPVDRRLFLEKARTYLDSIERRGVRIPCRMTVSCKVNGHALRAESADLSIGGAYLAAEQSVVENTELTIAFTLHEPEETAIASKGRVAWVNSDKSRKKPSLPVGFGVEFTEIPDYASAAVRAFVESRRPSG
jgi:CheY-like chemotaxis protein